MKKFRKIYVEITNICNKHCSFCPDTIRAKAFMSKEKFEYIAKEISQFTDYVYLHVKGEPLLHPELEEILKICNKYNLKVNISTNGVLLEEKKDILKNTNIRQLNISLHSFENNDYLKLKEYMESVIFTANILASFGVIIRYKLWNAGEIDTNLDFIINMLEKEYNISLEKEPLKKDKKLKENIFLSIKSPFIWPDENSKNETQGSCYGLRKQIAILVDGTVVPCCVDNDGILNLGNIFEKSLENILNSQRAVNIKKGFENNKCTESLCKKCEYRNVAIT